MNLPAKFSDKRAATIYLNQELMFLDRGVK